MCGHCVRGWDCNREQDSWGLTTQRDMEEIIKNLNCKGEKHCNRKGGCVCLGPQKDHRPQIWWVRECLQYLKDQSRFLSKGSRLPIPGLYPLLTCAMKQPRKVPASFHTDQHPPKLFFLIFLSPCSLSLYLYVKLLLSLQEPQKHHLLPEAFLDFFTALVSVYMAHWSRLYSSSLCH